MNRWLEEEALKTGRDLGEMRKREEQGEPLDYILGHIPFDGLSLRIDRRALIPRPETEELVSIIGRKISPAKGEVLVDLCAGSGCMGLALKKRFPSLHVILSDLSAEALSLAKENSLALALDVEMRQGDFLDPLEGVKIDYLVCNPPYIGLTERKDLSPSVLDYEPSMALFGGEEGMFFYEKLAKELPLTTNLFLELHPKNAQKCHAMLGGEIFRDLFGKERFLIRFRD